MKNTLDFRQISLKLFLWATETRGVTSIELGLMVSGISAVLASAGMVFGEELRGMFDALNTAIDPNAIEYDGE